jgi:hypothetical protein
MRDVEKEKEMCGFLEKKLDKFREYQSVTEKMKQIVQSNDGNNDLSGLINRRQKCIGAIENINSSIEKIVKNGSMKLSHISYNYKALIDRYLLNIKEILIQVNLMDKELVAIVAEQGENIKTELLNMRNKRQAARGYYTNKRYSPKFLDTRR